MPPASRLPAKQQAMPANTTAQAARSSRRGFCLKNTHRYKRMNTGLVYCSTTALAAVVRRVARV